MPNPKKEMKRMLLLIKYSDKLKSIALSGIEEIGYSDNPKNMSTTKKKIYKIVEKLTEIAIIDSKLIR